MQAGTGYFFYGKKRRRNCSFLSKCICFWWKSDPIFDWDYRCEINILFMNYMKDQFSYVYTRNRYCNDESSNNKNDNISKKMERF